MAHPSRWRLALLLLLMLGLVAMGLFIAGVIGPLGEESNPLIGWACTVLFGVFFAMGVPRLFATGPDLRVDWEGIWWRRWSAETIPWDAIETISERRVNRQSFLCVELVDPAAFPPLRAVRRLAAVNRGMGFGDVSITTVGTDRSFKELVAAVEHYLRADQSLPNTAS